MTSCLRRCVSQGRQRFTEDGFDLDLTYITDRVIAMAYPCVGCESLWRNCLSDVVQLLQQRHSKAYRIYNLCAEPRYADGYSAADFEARVEHFPFSDHGPPPLHYLRQFCESADRWLAASESNVIVVHCKAGKGRTGVFICAYLMHSLGMCADAALDTYLNKRGGGGVQNPCQVRWIHYWGQRRLPINPWFRGARRVARILLRDSQHRSAGEKAWIGGYARTGLWSYQFNLTGQFKLNEDGSFEWNMSPDRAAVDVSGDFFCTIGKDILVWAHTEFIPDGDKLVFNRAEIDRVAKRNETDRHVEVSILFEPLKEEVLERSQTMDTTIVPEFTDKSTLDEDTAWNSIDSGRSTWTTTTEVEGRSHLA